MCYLILGTEQQLIAEEDITVYKMFKRIPDSEDLESPYQKFIYQKGENLPEKQLVPIIKNGIGTIQEGYHSYSESEIALSMADIAPYRIVLECTIPKGASYYGSGYCSEIVSSQIIINFDKIV